MISHQLALIRREIWEHRSIYVTPAVVAIIMATIILAVIVGASVFNKEVELAIFGASNLASDVERSAFLTMFFLGTSWIFLISLAILTVFYSLDSLYAERKDKSILFWRSLPVTDGETVVSKLLTAVVLLPLVTVVAIIATQIVSLIIVSVWVMVRGGNAAHLIWGSVAYFDNWFGALIVVQATALWMSPFVGWFLFVSAYSKRMPLLMAFMPLILIPLLEYIAFRTHYFADAVGGRAETIPLFRGMGMEKFFDEERLHVNEEAARLLSHIDIGQFLASPGFWLGLVVCGLFTAAAIYVRRYRDES